jgi:hypothetical protein
MCLSLKFEKTVTLKYLKSKIYFFLLYFIFVIANYALQRILFIMFFFHIFFITINYYSNIDKEKSSP